MTGELGNKIDSLWEIFWNGGITNPLDVVEQMTVSLGGLLAGLGVQMAEHRGQGGEYQRH